MRAKTSNVLDGRAAHYREANIASGDNHFAPIFPLTQSEWLLI
jgi:hypothetical protein